MRKSLLAIIAVLAMLSAGFVMSDTAQAGASASAATKYSKASAAGSWSTDFSASRRR